MRLTEKQQRQILQLVRQHLGDTAHARLFGSRLHDIQRGGDVDLLIETAQHVTLLEKAALKAELEGRLNLPVDLVFHRHGTPLSPFQAIADSQAQSIEGSGR